MSLFSIFKNKVVANASWIIVCRIIQAICSLIVTMITARYLGPSNFGLIHYASSICTFFLPIMQLGLPNTQVNELVNNKEKEGLIIGTSLVLSMFSSFFCVLGVVSFTLLANVNEHDTILVCLLYSLLLVFQSVEIVQYWFQTHFKFKYVSFIVLFAYIVTSAYKIFLLANERSIYEYAISYTLDHFIIAILLFITFKKTSKLKLSFNKDLARKLLSKSKYYIISNLMIVIFAETDRVMLKIMLGNEINGLYSAAYALACMFNFLYDAIVDSYRPSIMKSKLVDEMRYENNLRNLNCIIIYLSIIVCICVSIFARLGIMIVYGNEFLEASSVLRIVIWYTIFAYVGVVRNIWLLVENKQKILWKLNLIGAILNVGMNYFLIPRLGAEGAAIASLFTQFVTNILLTYAIPSLRSFGKIIIFSLNPVHVFRLVKDKSNE